MSLGNLFKEGIKKATTWVGSTIGGPTGALVGSKVGEALGGALFDRKSQGSGRGGDLDIMDTGVSMPQYGGRMQAFKPSYGRTGKGYAQTVNFATLNAAWDARLGKFFTDDYKVRRTLVRKKVI